MRGDVYLVSYSVPDTKKLFEYLDELRNEAPHWKGSVYTLLGNHEVMNLMCKPAFISQVSCKQVWLHRSMGVSFRLR